MKATIYCGGRDSIDVRVDGAPNHDMETVLTMYRQVFEKDCNVIKDVITYPINDNDDKVAVLQVIHGILLLCGLEVRLRMGETA